MELEGSKVPVLETCSVSSLVQASPAASGLYVLTPYLMTDRDALVPIKVGLSLSVRHDDGTVTGGLHKRLDSYLLYYPLGYTLLGCYTTSRSRAVALESALHSLLLGKQRDLAADTHSHTGEWFYLSWNEIRGFLRDFERVHVGRGLLKNRLGDRGPVKVTQNERQRPRKVPMTPGARGRFAGTQNVRTGVGKPGRGRKQRRPPSPTALSLVSDTALSDSASSDSRQAKPRARNRLAKVETQAQKTQAQSQKKTRRAVAELRVTNSGRNSHGSSHRVKRARLPLKSL